MELLEKIERGYPAEYLLARIRGRRASLNSEWESCISGASPGSGVFKKYYGITDAVAGEFVRRSLAEEYRWVYSRMDSRLQGIFRLFFEYRELRTFSLCFRYRVPKDQTALEQALNASMLSGPCKEILKRRDNLESMIEELERQYSSRYPWFGGISAAPAKGGLRALEHLLIQSFLKRIGISLLHESLQVFFSGIIDARNIISLAKHLRWESDESLDFIPGGKIRIKVLLDILRKRNFEVLLGTICSLTNEDVRNPGLPRIENALYRGMTRMMTREGRELSGVGTILEYLWRCSVEAMNIDLLFHGRMLKRGLIEGEVIR